MKRHARSGPSLEVKNPAESIPVTNTFLTFLKIIFQFFMPSPKSWKWKILIYGRKYENDFYSIYHV